MRYLVLTVLILTSTCSALEVFGIDYAKEEDKQSHFWLGAAIAGGSILALEKINPEAKWYTKLFVGTVMSAVIGAAKEGFDTQDRQHHDPDVRDFIATSTGGALVSTTFCWKF